MADAAVHTVRFEPAGIEMDVREGETVLDAAFRQGISVMHGCKEGQCSSCKSQLVDGDVELLRYSTFALPEAESEAGRILLCRTLAFSDLTVELLNYDEDLLSRSIAVKDFPGRVASVDRLTHDMCKLTIVLDSPFRFWAGQFVDLTIPGRGVTRAYSMANAPDGGSTLSFIIKRYADGAFSSLLSGALSPGDAVSARGPFGTCFRREGRTGPMILVGGGSGMSPLRSILTDHAASGEQRPVRFFYGARTRADLFLLDEFRAFEERLPDFRFIPALSHAAPGDAWEGETGLIHETLRRSLAAEALDDEADAYACGPPPMIDAVLPVLRTAGIEPERIRFDKFTPATR